MGKRKGGFPGPMGGGVNMQQMMKQAQKMQDEMKKTQATLEEREFTGSSGGDMAQATVNGKLHLLSVKIKPEAVDPEDVEMLEDMVLAAVKAAQETASATVEEEMAKITGGMNLGGLF